MCIRGGLCTLRGGKWEGSAGAAKSQMQISPSSAPEASRFGAIALNSRPRTWILEFKGEKKKVQISTQYRPKCPTSRRPKTDEKCGGKLTGPLCLERCPTRALSLASELERRKRERIKKGFMRIWEYFFIFIPKHGWCWNIHIACLWGLTTNISYMRRLRSIFIQPKLRNYTIGDILAMRGHAVPIHFFWGFKYNAYLFKIQEERRLTYEIIRMITNR